MLDSRVKTIAALGVAEQEAAAQSARIGIAKSDLYPRFSLIGSIGFASSSGGGIASNKARGSQLFNGDSLRYTVGPTFSWPIFNYGRLKNKVRVQDARFQQAALNYQRTVLNAAREVEDALTAYVRGQSRLTFLQQSSADAGRSVELALVPYREGSVTYQRVLDTQRFLVQQQDRETSTRGEIALSLIAAYKALGGGWNLSDRPPLISNDVEQAMHVRTDWSGPISPEELTDEVGREANQ